MMPHKFRPVTALLLFTGLNAILVSTITPVYDSVCFHPYWERRDSVVGLNEVKNEERERHRLEREAALARESESTQMNLQVKS